MKLNKIIVAATVLLTISIGAFYGCKKTTKAEKQFDEVAAKAAIKAKIQAERSEQILIVDQKADFFTYTNKAGIEKKVYDNTSNLNTNCAGGVNCANYDPGNNEIEVPSVPYIKYISRLNNCASGSNTGKSDVTVIWEMSVPYDLVLQNPNNANQKSKGTIRFKNYNNGTIVSTFSNLIPTLTNLGVDPDCAVSVIYQFKIKVLNVDNANFNQGIQIQSSFISYTNCSEFINITAPFTSSIWNFDGSTATQPCLRTDKVYMNPNTGPNNCMSAAGVGNNYNCSFPYGYVYPNFHVLEYKLNSSTTWNTLSPFGPYDIVFINAMIPGTGLWNVRYKNRVTSPSCDGNWVTENWNL